MKAVILAAGVGSRLAPLTDNSPKGMIAVNGQPLVLHQIKALLAAGLAPSDIIVVTGHAAHAIRDCVPAGVQLLHNEEFASKNNIYSFWLLRHLDDDFLLLNSDVYFPKALVKRFIDRGAPTSLVVDSGKPLAEEEMKVELKHGVLRKISKKLRPNRSDGEYIGLARFAKQDAAVIFRKAEELLNAGQTGVWYENAIAAAVDEVSIRAYRIRRVPWIEIDTHEDLAKARELLPRVEQYDQDVAARLVAAAEKANQPKTIVKSLDAWYTVLLTDPVAIPLTHFVARRLPWVTPNLLTAMAFALGLVAAALFWHGSHAALIVGALLYQFCFILDCMDGKLARLTNRSSNFAAFYDLFLDLLRTMICLVALVGGQLVGRGPDNTLALLGVGIAFVYGFAIINLQKIGSVRRSYISACRKELRAKEVALAAELNVSALDLKYSRSQVDGENDDPSSSVDASSAPTASNGKRPGGLWGMAVGFKQLLERWRIRIIFFSSIEIQCGALVVAPLFYPYLKQALGVVFVLAMLQFLTLPLIFHAKMKASRDMCQKSHARRIKRIKSVAAARQA